MADLVRVNPPSLAKPSGFSHAVIARGTTIHLAGQTGMDAQGAIVAGGVKSAAPFSLEVPRTLVPATMSLVIRHAYAVTRDGQRLLVPVLDPSNPPVVTAVPDWPATLGK